jgi:hypothetical protein
MLAEDKSIWDRFLLKFPGRFESVEYDLRVGQGATPAEELEENYARMVTQLSQLRIDVLAWAGDQPTIIEIKPRAVVAAVGQLQAYRILFIRDFQKVVRPNLLMVCETISRDVTEVFLSVGIPVEVV